MKAALSFGGASEMMHNCSCLSAASPKPKLKVVVNTAGCVRYRSLHQPVKHSFAPLGAI